MIAAELRPSHRGCGIRFGSEGGTIEHAEQQLRKPFDNRGGNAIDTHVWVHTTTGLRHFVFSPSTDLEVTARAWS